MQMDAVPSDPATRQTVLGILKQRFSDQISTAEAIRERHGKDESYHASVAPDAVFFAETTEEIADAVLFFASDMSNYITGQILSVSGGLTMAD